jgi:hypothetical protein
MKDTTWINELRSISDKNKKSESYCLLNGKWEKKWFPNVIYRQQSLLDKLTVIQLVKEFPTGRDGGRKHHWNVGKLLPHYTA